MCCVHVTFPCPCCCVVDQLSRLRALRHLDMSHAYDALHSRVALSLLSHLSPTVTHLSLAMLQLDDATLTHIVSSTPALHSIDVTRNTQLTPHGCVVAFIPCTQLHTITWPREAFTHDKGKRQHGHPTLHNSSIITTHTCDARSSHSRSHMLWLGSMRVAMRWNVEQVTHNPHTHTHTHTHMHSTITCALVRIISSAALCRALLTDMLCCAVCSSSLSIAHVLFSNFNG